jgi:long-subunit acyl-CoA synthetase (AMP-forming)
VVALVVLDPAGVEAERVAAGIGEASFAELTRHPHIRRAVRAAVDAGNAELSRVEQVRREVVLDHEWTPGSAELTPTGKVRRERVLDRYRQCIEELYA